MSTISSQLIVTSSALVEDLYKIVFKTSATDKHYVFLGRAAVLIVTIVAAILAWPNKDSILKLVSFAWAGFGGAFGPIILLSLYWRKLTAKGALFGMVAGAITVGIWGSIDTLSNMLYEIVPGFAISLIIAVVVSKMTYKHDPVIQKEYDDTMELLEQENK